MAIVAKNGTLDNPMAFNQFFIIKNIGIDTYDDMVVTNMDFINLFLCFVVAPKWLTWQKVCTK